MPGAARQAWPDADPIGKRFRTGPEADASWLTVVGVVGDITHNWFFGESRPTFYRPLAQSSRYTMSLVIRARNVPTAVTPAVRSLVLRADPNVPIYEVYSMRRVMSDRMIGLKYAAAMMGVFGAVALVLSAVGIYGLMAYSVSRRTREIGVRMALGAAQRDVLRLMLGNALKLTALGIAVGLLLAFGAGKIMAAMLFGTISLDVATFAGFTLVLAGSALLAGYLPARRARKVDPTTALRME